MMNTAASPDPFDLDFDADDEFTSSLRASDPFADFPPARAPDAPEVPLRPVMRDFDGGDPLSDDLHQPEPPSRLPNPVHEMIAGAEAAFASDDRVIEHDSARFGADVEEAIGGGLVA